jgi:hypothetical protein
MPSGQHIGRRGVSLAVTLAAAGVLRRGGLDMIRLNVNDARCVALFASELQRSDAPAAEALAEAIRHTVRRFGIAGCASRMAQEFGDHPEAAASRMRWIRQLVSQEPAPAGSRHARPGGWPTHPVPGRYTPRPATGSAHRAA